MKRSELLKQRFDEGSSALAHAFSDMQAGYLCPLCLRTFTIEVIDELTFEHVPPESVGRTRMVLTCRTCNNAASGKHGVDTHAARAEINVDFMEGKSDDSRTAKLEFGSSEVNVRSCSVDRLVVEMSSENNSPEMQQKFQKLLENAPTSTEGPSSFTLTFGGDRFSARKANVSWLRAGYLAVFAALGYRYILRSSLDIVRAQIESPDTQLISRPEYVFKDTDKQTRLILVVSKPDWIRGLAVQMGRHLVFLPRYQNDGDFYKRLDEAADNWLATPVEGRSITWPTHPVHAFDFAG